MTDCGKGRFLAPESIEENRRERREEKAALKRLQRRRKAVYWAALVLCDMALMAMIHKGLIDQMIGVAMLAAVSAFCGRGTA